MEDVHDMDDVTAGAVSKLLRNLPESARQVAICDYVVKE
jgi:hypothetical protein